MAKIKVNFNDLEQETESLFDDIEETAAPEPKRYREPSDGPHELNLDELDYSEVEWDDEREAEMEEAVNAEFDRTYEQEYDKKPFYKRWWFPCLLVLLGLAIIAGVLWNQGKLPGMLGVDENATEASVTTAVKDDVPKAKDIVLPAGAELRKIEDGKWGIFLDDTLVSGYNGIASNDRGTWFIKNGYVDFGYTGLLKINGKTYQVNGGRVDTTKPVNANTTNAATLVDSNDNGSAQDNGQVSNAQSPQENVEGTPAQEDALATAVDLVNQMSFSREWLIAQIESEGHAHDDAVWAADHCGANWNEQARLKAQEYLDLTSFTYEDLIAQLEFEGFTHQQAVYGADSAMN